MLGSTIQSFVGSIIIISSASAFQLPISSGKLSLARAACTKLESYSPLASSTVTLDIAESAPRDIVSLYDWASNYGIQTCDGFELTSQDGGYDVYAITNQNIPSETPILCVPNELILTANKARLEFGSDVTTAENTLILSDHFSFYLFLKILKEYELGDQSYWYTWLNSLPRYYSTGSSMTDYCFSCLPPYAAKQAQEEKARVKRFQLALDTIPFLSPETKSNSELINWAYNVVQTRYQENSGGDYCLIPMCDYFNHGGSSSVDVYVTFDDDGNCYATSLRDIGAGEALRICYCDPTNPSQILAKYGFLDESSTTTYCKWIAEEPSSEIFQMGYPSKMLFSNDGGISNEVWDILLYTELGKISPEQQQAFYQAHTVGDEDTKSTYHNQYFGQTLAALQQHLSYVLNELEELSVWQMTKQDNAGEHPRLPLIMRHNEMVKNIFLMVQHNLDSMR